MLAAGWNTGPEHPDPYHGNTAPDQYVGSMTVGTLSTVDIPVERGQLRCWTEQVERNNGFHNRGHQGSGTAMAVVPRHPGEGSPTKYVIYVVKENRTYDQVFGSPGKGNGESAPTAALWSAISSP
jgi:phospholipase C